LEKLAAKNQEHKAILEEMDERAPLAALGDQMPPDMRSILIAIGTADRKEGVHSMYTSQSHYDETVGFLHMYSHANPLFLEGGADDHLPHAAHAITDATTAVLRAVGYRLAWAQNAIVAATLRISSFESLGSEERARILGEVEQASG
jgi:hypothetical protein